MSGAAVTDRADRAQAHPDSDRDEVLPASRRVENADYAAFVRRMMRAYARRVGEGDPEDLTAMLDLAREFDAAIAAGVDGLRAQGWSWAKIGRAAGITRQSAFERWGGGS